MKRLLLGMLSLLLLAGGGAVAADDASWLTIGGDYRFRYDYLKGSVPTYLDAGLFTGSPAAVPAFSVKNDSLMLNRFGMNVKAAALEDVTVKARLLMYKVWGHETSMPIQGSFFADRAFGVNDGTIGHVPSDNALRVDYGYATVSNIFDAPLWISVGRRPSTGGIPSNIRQNREKVGTGGIPSLMVDYAFDGMTVGYAPDIDALPGAYVKLCYGKGFDSGYQPTTGTTLKDTDFAGLNMAVYATDNLHVELQYQKGWNIFDAPSDGFITLNPATGAVTPFFVSQNLGDIDWAGGVIMGNLGPLNLFLSAAASKTDPNGNRFMGDPMMPGLLFDIFPERKTGYAGYVGARYDMNRTKIGVEYNHGTKNWIGMVPAGDDIWTSKLGTRGDVYEIYIIQELRRAAIAPNARAFVRLGYQYYDFEYTGSNFWIGTPKEISKLSITNPMDAQMLAPVEKAKDLYLTFDVQF